MKGEYLMDYIVTLNELLNINNTIQDNALTKKGCNQLIDEVVCDRYDTLLQKKKLQVLFSKFKSARYLYDFPIEHNIKISSNAEVNLSQSQKNNKSLIENAIMHYVDKQILTTNVYNSIIKLSFKLTESEVIYLINTFLAHSSEEDIADLIGISKTYLQKIKKSCIVKMWVDLHQYCDEDD